MKLVSAVPLLAFYLITTLSVPMTTANAAAVDTVVAGEYLAKLGGGTLLITARKKGHYFKINSYGANGHSCFVEGIIENGVSIQKPDADGENCTITFTTKSDGIAVTDDEKPTCSYFCGARAHYKLEYYKTADLCGHKVKNKNLKLFKTYYSKKMYELAEKTLRKVYDACEPYLSMFEKMDIVNDLAVTYKNMKKKEACLELIKPFDEQADMSETDIKDGYPPAESETLIPIVKKLKFNRDLCRNLK